MANGASTKSVIYTSYLMNGTAYPCSEIVAHWLLHARSADGESQQPVRRLVVGHQPHADAPLTLNVAGLQVTKPLPIFTFSFIHFFGSSDYL